MASHEQGEDQQKDTDAHMPPPVEAADISLVEDSNAPKDTAARSGNRPEFNATDSQMPLLPDENVQLSNGAAVPLMHIEGLVLGALSDTTTTALLSHVGASEAALHEVCTLVEDLSDQLSEQTGREVTPHTEELLKLACETKPAFRVVQAVWSWLRRNNTEDAATLFEASVAESGVFGLSWYAAFLSNAVDGREAEALAMYARAASVEGLGALHQQWAIAGGFTHLERYVELLCETGAPAATVAATWSALERAWQDAEKRPGLTTTTAPTDLLEKPNSLVEYGNWCMGMCSKCPAADRSRHLDEAERVFKCALKIPAERHIEPYLAQYGLACLSSLRGQQAEGLQWLQEAARLGFDDATHVESDDDLKLLRVAATSDTADPALAQGWAGVLAQFRENERRHDEDSGSDEGGDE